MSEAVRMFQAGRAGGRLVEAAGRAARRFGQTVDNAINPIIVKELRQAVNGRFVAAALTLFLGISVVTIAIALIDSGGRVEAEAGADVLVGLNATLLGVCLFLLPLQAGWRFASERSDNNVDLMFITTIEPRSIIAGKLGATVMLAGLIYAACLPFMTLTYLLRGVDLPTIFTMIVFGFSVVVGGVMLALFAASAPMHRGFRVLMAVGVLGLLAVVYQAMIGWSAASLRYGMFGVSRDPAEFWGMLLMLGLLFGCGVYLLFRFSVAMISAPTSNRALPVRLAMMGTWGVFTAVMWVVTILEGEEDALIFWFVASVLFFALGMVIAVCERDRWGTRVARTIPHRRIGRLGAMLLYSGSANGLLWAWGMVAICVAGYLVFPWAYEVVRGSLVSAAAALKLPSSWTRFDPGEMYGRGLAIGLGLVGYVYMYAMAGLLVRRYLLKGALPSAHTWAVGLMIAGLACAMPPMLAFILEGDLAFRQGMRWWMLGNPTSLFGHDSPGEDQRYASLVFVGAAGVSLTIVALPWAVDQLARFVPADGSGMSDAEIADAGERIARQSLTVGGTLTVLTGLGVWIGWLINGLLWVGLLTLALLLLGSGAWVTGRRVVWRRRWGRRSARVGAIALLAVLPIGTIAGLTTLIADRKARAAEGRLATGSSIEAGARAAGRAEGAAEEALTPPPAAFDEQAPGSG